METFQSMLPLSLSMRAPLQLTNYTFQTNAHHLMALEGMIVARIFGGESRKRALLATK
jgi:hypothetical protein